MGTLRFQQKNAMMKIIIHTMDVINANSHVKKLVNTVWQECAYYVIGRPDITWMRWMASVNQNVETSL